MNLVCFRRHGHNEIDNPRFTNPKLYSVVDITPSIADVYAQKLVDEGVVDSSFAEKTKKEYTDWLMEALKKVDEGKTEPK